jgi:hypothetical protein
MKRLIIAAALMVAGCSWYDAHNEEQAFEIWDKGSASSNATERCARMKRVADAWAKAGNTEKFEKWDSRAASGSCWRAQMLPGS